MLKHVLLSSAFLMATPAMAQTTPASPMPPAAATPPAATPPAPPTAAMPPAPPAADPAPAPVAADPGPQIADVVTKEFPSYDKNGDGKLSQAEFGAWMFALRKAADPALKDDAANKKYVAGAFATADTDKSKSVSKDELTNYLVQGQKNAPPSAAVPAAPPAAAAGPGAPPPAAPAPAPAPGTAPEPAPAPAPAPVDPAAPKPN